MAYIGLTDLIKRQLVLPLQELEVCFWDHEVMILLHLADAACTHHISNDKSTAFKYEDSRPSSIQVTRAGITLWRVDKRTVASHSRDDIASFRLQSTRSTSQLEALHSLPKRFTYSRAATRYLKPAQIDLCHLLCALCVQLLGNLHENGRPHWMQDHCLPDCSAVAATPMNCLVASV